MSACACGCRLFKASQTLIIEVIVDEKGCWYKYIKGNNIGGQAKVKEWGKPHGPYFCTKCGKEYDRLG